MSQADPTTHAPLKHKRRWLRYSLRTMLVLVTLLCLWLGLVVHRANKQKHVVEIVRSVGGSADYDKGINPSIVTWLSGVVGEDYIYPVRGVHLRGDGVTGEVLKQLQELPSLSRLEFYETNLSDDELRYLEPLGELWLLRIDSAHVTDAGLARLRGFKNLINLTLRGSRITDVGLKELQGLTRLTCLELKDTRVTDHGLDYLSGMNLHVLWLVNCPVSDAGIKKLAAFPELTNVSLDGTRITDAGLQDLTALREVEALSLAETGVTDAGLANLMAFPKLEELSLAKTQVTDAGLVHLGKLAALKRLDLNGTKISDAGLAQLKPIAANFNESVCPNLHVDHTNVTQEGLFRLLYGKFYIQDKVRLVHDVGAELKAGMQGVVTQAYHGYHLAEYDVAIVDGDGKSLNGSMLLEGDLEKDE